MKKKDVLDILNILTDLYPDAQAELDYTNPFELLVAVILSAQCTDVRVNMVTNDLFKLAPDARALMELPIDRLETVIKPCGLYKTKAKNLHLTAEKLVLNWNGQVPENHEALKSLPGVGQKTANVVVSNAFGIPAIAVDTHVFRVSNRLGIANAKTVEETEVQLEKAIDRSKWTQAHHQLIFHGRRVCKARKPDCENCALSHLCKYNRKRLKETKQ